MFNFESNKDSYITYSLNYVSTLQDLKKKLIDNIFINDKEKEKLFNIYCTNRRKNFILENIVRRFKFKKQKLLNEQNLYMTEEIQDLDPLKQIKVVDGYNYYIFDSEEILKIINISLTNSYELFPEPKYPKNRDRAIYFIDFICKKD